MASPMRAVAATLIARLLAVALPVAMVKRAKELEFQDDGFTDACGSCNADCSAAGAGAICGDGEACPELEFCDDGYTDACGSCNADCLPPAPQQSVATVRSVRSWSSVMMAIPMRATAVMGIVRGPTICGDAILECAETCDDGNAVDDGNGCSGSMSA